MLFKSTFFFILSAFFLFSCQRAADEKTKVTFKMPGIQASATENSFPENLGVLQLSTNLDTWRPITPTGLTGEYDFNCFFITVSAPDLNIYSAVTGADRINFGEMSAPARAGADISMDVAQGGGRIFRLFGMHASTGLDCYNVGKINMKYENLSRPYLVGRTDLINIGTSATPIVIPLQMTNIDLMRNFEYWDWTPLSTRAQPASSAVANLLETTLDTGIFGGNYVQNKCLPLTVSARENSSLVPAMSLIPDNFSVALSSDLSTAVPTYENARDCLASVSAATSFSTQFKYSTTRWIAGNINLPRKFSNSFNSGGFVTADMTVAGSALTATTVVPAALVNEFIYNDSCQPISWVPRAMNWSTAFDFSTVSSSSTLSLSLPGSATVSFFSNASCTNPIIPDVTLSSPTSRTFGASVSANSVRTIYVKYLGLLIGDQVDIIINHNNGSPSYSFFKSRVIPPPTSVGNPVRLKISGPSNFPSSAVTSQSCLGPFKVATVDENGIEIYMPLRSYDADVSFLNTQLQVFSSVPSKAPCESTTELAAGSTFTLGLGSGRSSQLFYVRTLNTTISPNTQYVYMNNATISGIPILYRDSFALHFDVDGTQPASEASPAICSGTTCRFYGL